jgi:Rieske Fe-S protein
MQINRRQFVVLGCSMAAGCASQPGENQPIHLREVSIDAGPTSDYATDGVYDHFRDRGFFIVRHGPSLTVISSFCTHRRCKLRAEPDHSFYCKCHGSTFDPEGHVTEGPAVADLPVLPSSVDAQGRLWVHAVAG